MPRVASIPPSPKPGIEALGTVIPHHEELVLAKWEIDRSAFEKDIPGRGVVEILAAIVGLHLRRIGHLCATVAMTRSDVVNIS